MHSCALTRNLLVRSTAINKQDKLLNAPLKVGVSRGLIIPFPRPNVYIYIRRIIYIPTSTSICRGNLLLCK